MNENGLPSRNFPETRLRRLRSSAHLRRLTAETSLTPANLIQPIFVTPGSQRRETISSMPGIERRSADLVLPHVEKLVAAGVSSIALFPVIPDQQKSNDGKEAFNRHGLVPSTIRQIKEAFPAVAVISDVALDPYTVHGQDGVINQHGYVLNDATSAILCKQALVCAEAGADIIAPSDMMDGRIGAIRQSLENNNFTNTVILSYAAKYASCFYGPFRNAVGSSGALGTGDKTTYQMNPANSDEALHEVAMDLREGADAVMVKPAMAYSDVIWRIKSTFKVPTFAYQVSGEYSMIKAAAANGWIDERAALLESLLCIRRAGADAILTYGALQVANWLISNRT